jgi:hypothetical protein
MTEEPLSPAPSGGSGDGADGVQPGKRSPSLGDFFWVGTACAISIVLGGGIGYAIDDAAGTLPWFTIAGLAFGVVSAVLLAVNQFRKFV